MHKIYKERETVKLVLFGLIIFGIVELCFIRLVFPDSYSNYLLLVPAYFLLLGVIVLLLLSRMKRNKVNPARAIARMMLFNVIQILVSFLLLFMVHYLYDFKDYAMLISFFVFYIFFMGIKLFILYDIDKRYQIDKKRLRAINGAN